MYRRPSCWLALSLQHLQLPLNRRIEVVLYRVVSASWQILRDLRPPIAESLVGFDDPFVFFISPAFTANLGVEMIMPALPALFADSARKCQSYLAPVLGS